MMKDPVRSKVRLQGVSDESLPKVFNDFFTHFEEHNFSFYMSDLKLSLTFDKTAVIDQKSVAKCPDGICGSFVQISSVAYFNISSRPL